MVFFTQLIDREISQIWIIRSSAGLVARAVCSQSALKIVSNHFKSWTMHTFLSLFTLQSLSTLTLNLFSHLSRENPLFTSCTPWSLFIYWDFGISVFFNFGELVKGYIVYGRDQILMPLISELFKFSSQGLEVRIFFELYIWFLYILFFSLWFLVWVWVLRCWT